MYRAKDNGRARFEMFDEELRARTLERCARARLREAVPRDELTLDFQPIVALADGTVGLSRRSCAGATRARARRRPTASSAWPRTPG